MNHAATVATPSPCPGVQSPIAPRFTLVMLVSVKPGGASALAEFRVHAAPLFAQYDLRVERQIKISGKGQIVGKNEFEMPDLIQIVSFASAEHFKAYVSDARYVELAAQRDASIRRMTVLAGMPIDVSNTSTPGRGPAAERLYGVGLVRFKPDGAAGLNAFNVKAQGLFARHGMHVESMLDVKQTLTPVGAPEGVDPQRVVVFFLDAAASLKAYVADPEYLALAPLRDEGLQTYDFFLGALPEVAAQI